MTSGDPWTDAQVAELTPGIVELVREIRSGRLTRALEVTRGYAMDETRHAEGGSGKGSHSDPTCSAAVNGQRRDPSHAILLSLIDSVGTYVNDLVVKSRSVQPVTGSEAHAAYKKAHETALTLAPCASIACPDQAPVGHRHCEDCNTYLEKRPGITQVPRDVILARARKRKQREAGRLHVSGPLAEEIA